MEHLSTDVLSPGLVKGAAGDAARVKLTAIMRNIKGLSTFHFYQEVTSACANTHMLPSSQRTPLEKFCRRTGDTARWSVACI